MNSYHATKKIIFIIIFICCAINNAFAIDTNAVKFFPLKVGNVYVYEHYNSTPFGGYRFKYKATVLYDYTINNTKYFYLKDFPAQYNNKLVRLDSLSGCIFKYDSLNTCTRYPYELLLDSFNIYTGDSIYDCQSVFIKKCYEQANSSILNLNTIVYSFNRTFSMLPFGSTVTWQFAAKIGLIKYIAVSSGGGGYSYESEELKGCIIDGILYGDTSIVDIKILSSEVPSGFKLHQNYPNPFNPITKIKFDIPNNITGNTKLVIFNIMGKEVERLFDGKLNTGSYESEWNASGYPSGVYFCRLVSENIVLTQKMLLVK